METLLHSWAEAQFWATWYDATRWSTQEGDNLQLLWWKGTSAFLAQLRMLLVELVGWWLYGVCLHCSW